MLRNTELNSAGGIKHLIRLTLTDLGPEKLPFLDSRPTYIACICSTSEDAFGRKIFVCLVLQLMFAVRCSLCTKYFSRPFGMIVFLQ